MADVTTLRTVWSKSRPQKEALLAFARRGANRSAPPPSRPLRRVLDHDALGREEIAAAVGFAEVAAGTGGLAGRHERVDPRIALLQLGAATFREGVMRVVNNHNNVASSRLRVTDLLLQRAIRLELDRYAHYWSMQGHVKEKEILVVIDA